MSDQVWGRYRVAYCEPNHNGECANFGVVLYGDGVPPEIAFLRDWSRFEAFTGWSRDRCLDWFFNAATTEGLALYEQSEQRGSMGIAMSCLRLTEAGDCLLVDGGECWNPLASLVSHFLIEPEAGP